jgi:gas vesicle protein
MTTRTNNSGSDFLMGIMAGVAIGAGLAIAFAPRSGAELRRRLRTAANDLGDVAAQRYADTAIKFADAVDGVATRAQELRDQFGTLATNAADTVAAGGQSLRDEIADAFGRGTRDGDQPGPGARTSPRSRS